MSFIWPAMLFSFVLLPLLIGGYLRQQRRRRQLAETFSSFGPFQAAARDPGSRRHLPPAFFLTGLTLLLLALARPEMVVRLPRIEGTVILAFDVSGSMAATDMEPNRMEAAKVAAQTFIAEQPPSVLIGVVAFSDGGFAVQPPTADREAIRSTIDRLTPQTGTSLGNGIYASLNALVTEREPEPRHYTDLTPTPPSTPTPVPAGTYSPAVIVLLTDGENTETPDPLEAAQAAAERGVRIYPVGIGSAAGATLEIDGFVVHTQLDEALLQQIAAVTDGAYYNAETEDDLRSIYENLDPQLVIKPEKMEVTALLAGLSILVLLVGGAFSLLWFHRVP